MIAAVLHLLGVPMGRELDATYEDHEFANIIRTFVSAPGPVSHANLKNSIQQRDTRYGVWGFKLPNIILNPEVFTLLRNPTLLFVFRDTVAIVDRLTNAANQDPHSAFLSVANLQQKLATLFADTLNPALAVSYEKAIAVPEKFITSCTENQRLDVDTRQQAAAVEVMQRSPADYLTVAGPASVIGHIEGFDCGDLVGWAINRGNEFETVKLQLTIDGEFIEKIESSSFRSDLWIYCHENLNHGFRWRFPPRYYDDRIHEITVSAAETTTARLANSTFSFKIPPGFRCFGSHHRQYASRMDIFADGYIRGWIYSRMDIHVENLHARALDDINHRRENQAASTA